MANTKFFIANQDDRPLGEVVSILGDGNCFFRAVARALEPDISRDDEDKIQLALRLAAIDYMRRNKDDFINFFDETDSVTKEQAFNQYIDRMSKNGVHADNYIQVALARYIGRKIYLVQDTPSSGFFGAIKEKFSSSNRLEFNPQLADVIDPEAKNHPLVLFYHRERSNQAGHYDLVNPMSKVNLDDLAEAQQLRKMSVKEQAERQQKATEVEAEFERLKKVEAARKAAAAAAEKSEAGSLLPASSPVAARAPETLPVIGSTSRSVAQVAAPSTPTAVAPAAQQGAPLQPKTLPVALFNPGQQIPVKFDIIDFQGEPAYKIPDSTQIKDLYNQHILPESSDRPSITDEQIMDVKAKAALALVQDLNFNVKLVGEQKDKWPNILAIWQQHKAVSEEQISKILANHTPDEQAWLKSKMHAVPVAETGGSRQADAESSKATVATVPHAARPPVPETGNRPLVGDDLKDVSDRPLPESPVSRAAPPPLPMIGEGALAGGELKDAADIPLPVSPESSPFVSPTASVKVETGSPLSSHVFSLPAVLPPEPRLSERTVSPTRASIDSRSQSRERSVEPTRTLRFRDDIDVRRQPNGPPTREGALPSEDTMLLRRTAFQRAKDHAGPIVGRLKPRAASVPPPALTSRDFAEVREQAAAKNPRLADLAGSVTFGSSNRPKSR